MLRRQADYEEKAAEDLPVVPKHLSEKEKEFHQVYSALQRPGAAISMAEVMLNNPDLSKEFIKNHRELGVRQLGVILAGCPTLQDIPLPVLAKLISADPQEISDLVEAARESKRMEIEFTEEEIKTSIDQARVLEVMEPSEEEMDQYEAKPVNHAHPLDLNKKFPLGVVRAKQTRMRKIK